MSLEPGNETPLSQAAILLREGDDVAVAKRRIPAGTTLIQDGLTVTLKSDIPPGHKIALKRVEEGEPIRKYGQIIGFATSDIEAGDWVHTRNLGFGKGETGGAGKLHLDYEFSTAIPHVEYRPVEERRTFPGFLRADGRVGTRNYVGLVSTVNCSASTVQRIADHFRNPEVLKEFPGIDGVFPTTHKSGCGQHLGGDDFKTLQRTLAGMADHPNVGAYLIAGLGCEVNQALSMAQNGGLIRPDSLTKGRAELPPILIIQEEGGIRKTVLKGIEETIKLLKKASQAKRTEQSVSNLIVGTNCGGSDGNSGITANPALGDAGDEFVRQGAGWVLAETTETYGAEHLLTRRAVSPEVGQKLVALMRWWEWYTGVWGASIDSNPSPGNKEGGLTTIYEKSLGALAKGGSTPLVEVYGYAERIRQKRLHVHGYARARPCFGDRACGGRLQSRRVHHGSRLLPGLQTRPCPENLHEHSRFYNRLEEDMDLDAGVILNGVPIADVGRQIFEELIQVAGGKKTKIRTSRPGRVRVRPVAFGTCDVRVD